MRHEAEQFPLEFEKRQAALPAVVDQEFNGETFDKKKDGKRTKKQHLTVFKIMSPGQWVTLRELEEKTGAPGASLSARVRELRQPKFGAHEVKKRRIPGGNGVYEYRLIINKNEIIPS